MWAQRGPELQTPLWGPPHWELPWPHALCPEVQAERRGRSEREWRWKRDYYYEDALLLTALYYKSLIAIVNCSKHLPRGIKPCFRIRRLKAQYWKMPINWEIPSNPSRFFFFSFVSTLAWKIPWTEEPGVLQSTGLLRVGHDWATSLSLFTFMHWRRKWQPTPVVLPGESQGRGSLVGCRLWGHTESDRTEVI